MFDRKKLGNKVVIQSANSSNDNEHYLLNSNKCLNMNIKGSPKYSLLTGSTVLMTGTIFNGIAYDNYRNKLYVCGTHLITTKSGSINTWWTLSSSDNGTTWGTVDQFSGSAECSSSANAICYMPSPSGSSGSIWVAGWHIDTTGGGTINASLRMASASSPTAWHTAFTYASSALSEDMFHSIHGAPKSLKNDIFTAGISAGGHSVVNGVTAENFIVARTNNGVSWSVVATSGTDYVGVRNRCMAISVTTSGQTESSNTPILAVGSLSGSVYGANSQAVFASASMLSHVKNGRSGSFTGIARISVGEPPGSGFNFRESVYLCGFYTSSTNVRWFVEKFQSQFDFTKSFDDFLQPGGTESIPNFIITDVIYKNAKTIVSASNLYAGGYYKKDVSSKKYWAIRRNINELNDQSSFEFTSSWTTVEELSIGDENEARAATFDSDGNMYVCGQINGTGSIRKYVLNEQYKNQDEMFSVSGTMGLVLLQRLCDDNGVDLSGKAVFLTGNFNIGNTGSYFSPINPIFTFEISSSTTFDASTLFVSFKDGNTLLTDDTSFFENRQNILNYGTFTDIGNGWHKFTTNFSSGSTIQKLKITPSTGSDHWIVTGSSSPLYFRNFNINFLQPLTTEGVEFYKNIDNQHNQFSYYNFGVLNPMSSGSLATTYGQSNGFILNNISEFPHADGIGQMKNLVLGTSYSGQIGSDDNDPLQVSQIGSVVKIMWPNQSDDDVDVKGYGDFSTGIRAGKLSTSYQYGGTFDVTEFDSLALYCFLRKEISGTLDDIIVSLERRPLKSTGYTIEQAIEYTTSGSYVEARLRDIQYKKEIDYGDLSIREIGWPIDIPLTNVKEVRISAKHKNGQSNDLNKNLIIYGRLIKSDEET